MKKLFWLTLTALTFFACSKSKSTTVTSSQWTINGITYKGLATTYSNSTLTSADASANYVAIVFYSTPSTNGTFTVIDGSLPATGTCLVTIGTAASLYSSVGKSGDAVNVTLSGGKITAAFSGITMDFNGTQTTASGTVIQQ